MMKMCVGGALFFCLMPSHLLSGGKEQLASPEMKVLEKRIGTWKTVTHIKPAAWTPDGGESKGDEKIELVLGGRFIQGKVRTQPGDVEALWLATYDPAKRRITSGTSARRATSSTGKRRREWSAAARPPS